MNQVDKRQVVSFGFLFVLLLSFSAMILQATAIPGYYNVTFVVGSGGAVSWVDETSPYHDGYISTGNFTMAFPVGDEIRVDALPNLGYILTKFNLTAANVTTSSFENPYRFTIANDLTINALFSVAAITYKITIVTTAGGSVQWTDETSPYHDGSVATGSVTASFPDSDTISFAATPASGYVFQQFTITDPSGVALLNPTDNPYVLVANANYTVTAYFVAAPTSTTVPGFSLIPDWIRLRLDITSVLEMVIGAIITVLGMVVLMRASGAWIVGLILLVVGFFFQEIAQPNLAGLTAFALELLFSAIFLYNASGSRKNK
jgi:hypothetical protein